MKTTLTVLAIAFLSILNVTAQSISENFNPNDFGKNIKFDPLNLVVAEFIVRYEQQITNKGSLEFTGIYGKDTFEVIAQGVTISKSDITGVGLGAGYRHYFIKKDDRLQGLYGRGAADFIYNIFDDSDVFENFTNTNIELGAGYQWVLTSFLKGLTLDVNAGGRLSKIISDSSDWTGSPFVHLSIGYSF